MSGSRTKTILAINNARKPQNDVRVRRAIAAAIDRKAVIESGAEGYGKPIGSHYVPGALGYINTTGKPLRHRQGPAPAGRGRRQAAAPAQHDAAAQPYARQGGEVIAAQLAQAGIVAQLHSVKWVQWLSGIYSNNNDDLTLVSHVESFDLGNFAKPDDYWGYQSPPFNALYEQIQTATCPADRTRLLAEEAVHAFPYQAQWVTVAHKNLKGLWKDMPVFVNDLSTLH